MELASHKRPRSDVAESYRALRTSILLSSSGAPPKVILVTSALPQEGKTTTSINTAIVLAQKGARVLLVDADLRRPNVIGFLECAARWVSAPCLQGAAASKSQSSTLPMFQSNAASGWATASAAC